MWTIGNMYIHICLYLWPSYIHRPLEYLFISLLFNGVLESISFLRRWPGVRRGKPATIRRFLVDLPIYNGRGRLHGLDLN